MKPSKQHPAHSSRPASSASRAHSKSFGLGLLSLALSACGGGGGGGGGTGSIGGGKALNEGSLSVSDFDYKDEHAPGFHPLGDDSFRVLARDELFTIFSKPRGGNFFELREDPEAGYGKVNEISSLFSSSESLRGAVSGQMDEDVEDELLVAVTSDAGKKLQIVQVDRLPTGQYQRTPLQTIPSAAWAFADARVSLGDLDGDGRQEIIVVARSGAFQKSAAAGQVWAFDHPEDGGGQLLSYARNAGHIDLFGLPIDVDGDGDKELVIGMSGDTTSSGRYVIRLYDLEEGKATMTQRHGWVYLFSGTDHRDSRAVVGDFDADGNEDLAWVGYKLNSSAGRSEFSIKLFEWLPTRSWSQYANWSLIDFYSTAQAPWNWAITAFSPSIGRDDLAVMHVSGGDYNYTALHYDRNLSRFSYQLKSVDRRLSGQSISLAASDVDSDGSQEVQIGMLYYGTTNGYLDYGYMEHGDQAELVWQDRIAIGTSPTASSSHPAPVLVPGDFDADGFAIRHTGRRSPKVGDPIPIAVLSAPPTVDGISQNYDDTESSYETGVTQGESIGVTTHSAVTYSASAGFDLFGLIGVGGRASLQKGLEKTETSSQQESIVRGHRGAYDADVIIFQGTLYETYEYMIIASSDPTAIGSLISLDIPIDANTYNWTVDYYNSTVAPEDQIGKDVLTHTPGDIQTYPRKKDLDGILDGHVHWDFPGTQSVGQGKASDYQFVSFVVEKATEEQRTITKGYGGGLSFGISVDADREDTEGATHGVFFASETTFGADVGKIEDPVEYRAWNYNWGFSIQTVGRNADADNNPGGYSSRKHSFKYLRYWAEPTGTGY